MPTEVGGYSHQFIGFGKNTGFWNREWIRAPRLAAFKQMAPTVNLSKNLWFNGSIIPAIPIRETKNGQAQTTLASLVRFHIPKKVSLRPFVLCVNSNFVKFQNFFTDIIAAVTDEGEILQNTTHRHKHYFQSFLKYFFHPPFSTNSPMPKTQQCLHNHLKQKTLSS